MKRNLLLVSALVALPLTAALAQNEPAGRLSPEEIVKARQAAYGLSAATFGEMKMALDAGAELRPLGFGARNLQRWARTLPTLFPEGSNVPPTQAKAGGVDRPRRFRATCAGLCRGGRPAGRRGAGRRPRGVRGAMGRGARDLQRLS